MSLTTFLLLAVTGLSLLLLFRSKESRAAQFLAVGEIALAGVSLFLDRVHSFAWPWSKGDTALVLAGAMAVLSLLIHVCVREKSWSPVLIFAAGLLVLVRVDVIAGL